MNDLLVGSIWDMTAVGEVVDWLCRAFRLDLPSLLM